MVYDTKLKSMGNCGFKTNRLSNKKYLSLFFLLFFPGSVYVCMGLFICFMTFMK